MKLTTQSVHSRKQHFKKVDLATCFGFLQAIIRRSLARTIQWKLATAVRKKYLPLQEQGTYLFPSCSRKLSLNGCLKRTSDDGLLKAETCRLIDFYIVLCMIVYW
jgi:hypothetical protein